MIHEYAVSPSLFSNPANLALLFQAFEAGSGRLISDYPRARWLLYAKAFIKQTISDQIDQRACIELLMGLVKRNVLLDRLGATWADDKNWINNAVDEHHRWKFRAILNEQPVPSEPDVIRYGPSLGGHPSWPNPGTRSVPRTSHEMVGSAASLINVSTTLILVDRNFAPSEARFLNVLQAFGEYLVDPANGQRINRIEYLTAYQKDRNSFQTPQLFENTCRIFVPSVIPLGIDVQFSVTTNTLLHKRLVLTDRGAILFEHGLDEGPREVLLARLAPDDFDKEWSLWHRPCMYRFTIAGTKS